MKKCHLSLAFAICAACSCGLAAQEHMPASSALSTERPYVTETTLAERDFPLLATILQVEPIRQLLAHDATLQAATTERWKRIASANHTCSGDILCKSKSVRFAPDQTEAISAALRRLYETNATFRDFLHATLKPASSYKLDRSQTEESTLVGNWERSANNINQMIAVYGEGAAPRYREIDSIAYASVSKSYAALITILLDGLSIEEHPISQGRTENDTLFFEPSLRFSLRLLQANSRDEAGRFWPLQSGENAAALQQLRSTAWAKFPYSVIVVPGAGSEIPNVSISPWGRERVRLSVQAYRAGKAPFILVSGGFVHPSQTPFCEALEMKRYLMEVYGIPASAILLEPYARHTTTNLRNASREVFSYGIPSEKPMLIVSDEAQMTYIASAVFNKRNRDELGYLPVTLGKRVSPTELEAIPSIESLYSDATDPLDP